MSPTTHRARSILAAVARAYPSAWQDLDGFRALRGCHDFMNWPDWCFVPVSGAYAVVSGGGGQRVRFEQSGHVGLVAGLGAWRITQGVYRFDSTLYEALLATPITDEIPVDVLHHLPGWCVYIETLGYTVYGVALHGFFAFMEVDAQSGTEELRLLLDMARDPSDPFDPVRGVRSLPLPLVGRNVAASIRSLVLKGVEQAQQHGFAVSEADLAPLTSMDREIAPLLSLLLYLCSATPDVAGADGDGRGAMALATLDPNCRQYGVLERGSAPLFDPPTSGSTAVMMMKPESAGMCARMFGARTGTRTCLALGQTWPRNGAS